MTLVHRGFPDILFRFLEIEHPFSERLADQEIGLGIAEFVVAVAGIGRIFGLPDEVVSLDERDVPSEFGAGRCSGLSLA